jgi:hypothetical protein
VSRWPVTGQQKHNIQHVAVYMHNMDWAALPTAYSDVTVKEKKIFLHLILNSQLIADGLYTKNRRAPEIWP